MSVTSFNKSRTFAPQPKWQIRGFPHIQWGKLLLWIAGIIIAGLTILPAFYLLLRATQSSNNLLELLTKSTTITALGNTLLLAGSVTIASLFIGVSIAWLTSCTDLPAGKWWAMLATLPLVIPSYVGAYLLAGLFAPKGILQNLLGVEQLPSIYGFPGAFLSLTLMNYPFVLLATRAGLKRLDPALGEAARSLGMSPRQVFWRVTLPQLRPAIVAGSLLVALYVLRDFGAVAMMRFNSFSRIIYIQYSSFFDRSMAAGTALILIGMTIIILWLEMKTRGKAGYQSRSVGCARQGEPTSLGRWRWVALTFVGGVVFVALILPAISLTYWVLRGIKQGELITPLWQPMFNSLTAGIGTAILTLLFAFPVALLAVRHPNKYSRWLEQIIYTGYALPGIVVALAFVFFGANYLPSLYQTVPMLLIGLLILFVPQAMGVIRATLLQLSPNLEAAGRSLGHSSWSIWRRITFPLLKHGLLAGGALAFLTAMKELPATLLLSPIGFETLSVDVWKHISEAFFAQAGMPALMLILLSSIPLAIITLQENS